MGAQSEAFLRGEGAAWLKRNKDKLPSKDDYIIRAIEDCPNIVPRRVLEIGCADGWRLKLMREKWGSHICGIEPGLKTSFDDFIFQGTADSLDVIMQQFNVVIYGFCLYLCDRDDLFQIVAEGDRVLEDGGYLIVYDFHAPAPHSRAYKHLDGILSYKMDYSKLWLANPAYSLYRRHLYGGDDDVVSVVILKKNVSNGWPLRDWEATI